MKKSRAVILFIIIVLLTFSATGCRMFKKGVTIDNVYPYYSKETLLKESELILKGTVMEQGESAMTNPDGTLRSEEGYEIGNCMVTDYTIRIEDLYKGNFEEETITVKVANGHGLSPDLILYGEDKTTYLKEPIDIYELETGKTYVFTLLPFVEHTDNRFSGYYTSNQSTFALTEEGAFKNSNDSTLNTATVTQEIAASVTE